MTDAFHVVPAVREAREEPGIEEVPAAVVPHERYVFAHAAEGRQ